MDTAVWTILILVIVLIVQHTRKKNSDDLAELRAQILRRLYVEGKAEKTDLDAAQIELNPQITDNYQFAAPDAPTALPAEPDAPPAQTVTRIEPVAVPAEAVAEAAPAAVCADAVPVDAVSLAKAEAAAETADTSPEKVDAVAETADTSPEKVDAVAETADTSPEKVDAAAETAVIPPLQTAQAAAETVTPAIAAAETVTVPAFASPAAPDGAFPQPVRKPESPAPQPAFAAPEPVVRFSAISVMLSVGVVLIIVAGLLFVRSLWNDLSGGGKLAFLGAGSALFFGVSALARRKLDLERTGMAFFTLGAAYLPISVWAAGYLHLLGDGLSGPHNKWLIALSFLIFSGIAAVAVKIYRQKSWAIGVLGGLSAAYFYLVLGFTSIFDHPLQWAVLFFAVYAAAFACLAHLLLDRLPLPFASVIEPFALVLTAAAVLPFFGLIGQSYSMAPAAFAALILAAAYLAPAVCDRLRQFTAIPAAVMTLLGFFLMLLPLLRDDVLDFCAYSALAAMLAAIIFCLLTARELTPEDTRIGFRYAAYALTALSVPFHLFTSHSDWYAALATAALTGCLVLLVRSTPGKQICAAAAGMGWLFCGDVTSWAQRAFVMNPAESYLLAGMLFLAGFAAFYWKKRIRNLPANLLFACSAAISAGIVLLVHPSAVWQTLCAYGIAAAAAGICYFLALHPRTREPWHAVYAALVPSVLFGMLMLSWIVNPLKLSDPTYGLLMGAAGLICFVLFFRAERLRHPVTTILFPALAVLAAAFVLGDDSAANWQDALALVLIGSAAGCFYFMALHRKTASPFHTVYGYLMAASLGAGTLGLLAGGCFGLAEETCLLIGSAAAMLCFVLFFRAERLRSVHANVIFPMLSAFSSMSMFWSLRTDVWQNAAAFVFILGAAALFYAMARSKHSAKPAYFIYGGMMSAVLICAVWTVWDCTLGDFHDYAYALIMAAVCAVCCAAFRSQARLRNIPADLIFPCGAALAASFSMTANDIVPVWAMAAAVGLLTAGVVYYWLLAFERDTREPVQHLYAALVPLILFAAANVICIAVTDFTESEILLGWTVVSLALAFTAYFTVRSEFHSVRQTMFGLLTFPPMVLAFIAQNVMHGGHLIITQQILCAAAAAAIWQLFAKRGTRVVPAAGFAVSLLLVMQTTGYAVSRYVCGGAVNFTVAMTAAVWLILLGGTAFFVRRGMLDFNGSNAIPDVTQAYLTACSVLFSLELLMLGDREWNSFYFIYTLGICLLAWFTSQRKQITMPALTAASMLLSAEAMREHTDDGSGIYLAGMIFVMCMLTALLPYLGIVSREDGERNPRSYVLTSFGGIMPFWLLFTSGDHTGDQSEWIIFFMLVMLAGYVLHFTLSVHEPMTRRHLFAAAAGLCTVALWLMPLVETDGTYWEGKLHLLPLIAFGAVIRILYGEETGTHFLFGIGIYSLLRLAGCAFRTESGADILTLIATALAIFIVSFYIKQKKWFLLGGATLMFTAVYMDIKLTNTLHWWVYLLLAGSVLIVIAATNETLKSRGDSLKERAGRFWEDWTW